METTTPTTPIKVSVVKLLLFLEVELMETVGDWVEIDPHKHRPVASILRSGINGNFRINAIHLSVIDNYGVASILRSGINGNKIIRDLKISLRSLPVASILRSGINGN